MPVIAIIAIVVIVIILNKTGVSDSLAALTLALLPRVGIEGFRKPSIPARLPRFKALPFHHGDDLVRYVLGVIRTRLC